MLLKQTQAYATGSWMYRCILSLWGRCTIITMHSMGGSLLSQESLECASSSSALTMRFEALRVFMKVYYSVIFGSCLTFEQLLQLISATDRHRQSTDHPIKFISRRQPNSLKFKIKPGILMYYFRLTFGFLAVLWLLFYIFFPLADCLNWQWLLRTLKGLNLAILIPGRRRSPHFYSIQFCL